MKKRLYSNHPPTLPLPVPVSSKSYPAQLRLSLCECMCTSVSSVQSLRHVWLFVTPWTTAHHASCPSPTPGVHPNPCLLSRWCIQPSHSLSSLSPPALNLSQHQGLLMSQLFASGSFKINPSNEHPGLISFRIDWLDLLAVHICVHMWT